ncbi:MAG: acetyl-CoA C-acetyltransferase [Marinobacter sp.]|nr:acetyl-CoA C-acetyltransferase [Marinobacter sp.]
MVDPQSASHESAAPESSRPRPVYLVDGARTPFLKARGEPGPFSPVDLAVQCGRPLLMRHPVPPEAYDQVILGCVNVVPSEMNPARIAALRMGMGDAMPAFTVQINCGSGMQSVDTAFRYIRDGRGELILAGGTEALSRAPMMLPDAGVQWLSGLNKASSVQDYAQQISRLNPKDFKPEISLAQGLTDPIVGMSMGQTAELLAHQFSISRRRADEYAASSHQRLARAAEQGWLSDEIIPAVSPDGRLFSKDDGMRPDTSPESLAKLKPAFEPPYGQVTPGNSSQVTDGASWLILASEESVERYGLEPQAVIIDSEWSALNPSIMGLGPVLSSTTLLSRHQFGLHDVDLWEINEAFAAQVLACVAAWDDAEFCRIALGREQPVGQLDMRKLNIDGGAVALGHPVGASGNRIVLHLMKALSREGLRKGVATECIGGGQSGAMLIETI